MFISMFEFANSLQMREISEGILFRLYVRRANLRDEDCQDSIKGKVVKLKVTVCFRIV